jgi:hypothetical protein
MKVSSYWLSDREAQQGLDLLIWICSSHGAIRTLEDLSIWGITKGLAERQVNVSI